MTRKKKKSSKKKLTAQKNKVRGVIANAKSTAYKPEAFSAAVQFQRQLAGVLTDARKSIGGGATPKFIRWVEDQTERQAHHLKEEPVDSSLSSSILESSPRPLHEEIEWIASRLAPHANVINNFRSLAGQVEARALAGDLDQASSVLEEIETTFGKSAWWVEASIAVAQSKGGLESQKLIATELRKSHPKSLMSYVARFASIRNEPSTTLNSFHSDTLDRIGRIKGQESLKCYLRFRLLWNVPHTARDLARVLLVAQSLSVVDLYETFVEVLQSAASTLQVEAVSTSIKVATQALNQIEDRRISNLAIGLSHGSYEGGAVESVSELWSRAQASPPTFRRCMRGIRRDGRDFRLAIIAGSMLESSRSERLNSCKGWLKLIRQIAALFRFDADFSSAWSDLEKDMRNWTFSPTVRACFFQLKALLEDNVILQAQCQRFVAANDWNAQSLKYPYLKAVYGSAELYGTNWPDGSFEEFRGKDEAIHPFTLFLMTCHAADLSLVDQLQELDRLASEANSRALVVIVRRAYLASLVEASRIRDTLTVSTESYFEVGMPAALLPLREDFARLKWRQLRQHSTDLMLPLVLYLSWRVTGNDDVAANLRYSYSDFLTGNGFESPADLRRHLEKWPRKQVVYFLRFVCVPDIMDMSAQIGSSREAQEMRREVCVLLSDLDPDGKSEYDDETFTITRSLSVQDGLRVLDSSRVHVDTGAIASWAERELEPNIARYRTLVESGIGVSGTLSDVWKELSGRPSAKFLEIPDSDADMILADLISVLRGKFLLDPSHGLDSYLSRRVRHHSMSGHLRGVCEDAHLMTTRDFKTGRYARNTYWNQRLSGITDREELELQRALARFCEDVDRIIAGLRTDTFRIASEEHPRGLFSITVSPAMFHLVRGALQPQISIHALCEICFPIFWTSLQPALDAARATLTTTAYDAISSSFHRLQAALRRIFRDPKRYSSLSGAIQSASEEVHRKIVGIADWFNRREAAQSLQTYSLDRAIEICLEAAQHSLKPFSPVIQTTVQPGEIATSIMLVQMAEIILPMLGNVKQHSHAGDSPHVEIHVAVAENKRAEIRMSSDIGPDACTREAVARVAKIRQEIEDGSYLERVRTEQNSGLTKIACVALATKNGTIKFDFIDKRKFVVAVTFEVPSHVELRVPVPGRG